MSWRRCLPWSWIHRGGLGYFVMGLIVLSGAIWSFGALVEIGNVATTKQSLTTLPVPFAGYLFAGSVDLFIFYGYLKCYGPAWQIALAVFHILIGLATSLWFQWQHSMGIVDPVAVSVVPALAVAVSLDTWVVSQLVDWFHARRTWDPTPPPPPPEEPADDPEEPAQPEPAQRTSVTRRQRALTSAELVRVEPLVAAGRKAYGIAQELGIPYPVVRQHMRDQELVSPNGQVGGS